LNDLFGVYLVEAWLEDTKSGIKIKFSGGIQPLLQA